MENKYFCLEIKKKKYIILPLSVITKPIRQKTQAENLCEKKKMIPLGLAVCLIISFRSPRYLSLLPLMVTWNANGLKG